MGKSDMASGTMITIKNSLSDKDSFSAYHVRPAKSMARGGIVILQEIFGLNGYIREVCDSFADDGFEVIAPALFDRAEKNIELGYDSDAVARGLVLKEAVDAYAESDILACAAHLSDQLKIAVIGYCWGGSLAWRMACRHSRFDAAICYYGGQLPGLAQEVPTCPVLAHFGRKDASIPMEGVEKFIAARTEVESHIYEADHGFSCHHRKQYDAASATLARSRSTAFLDRHLAGLF